MSQLINHQKKIKKIPEKQLNQFLAMLLLLLESSFSLQESLAVMQRSQQLSPDILALFQTELTKGEQLANGFQKIGCTSKEVSQFHFALIHGNLVGTLKTIVAQRERRIQQKKELAKACMYPIVLLSMLFILLLLMHQFFLPQLLATHMIEASHWGVKFIQLVPLIILGIGFAGLLGWQVGRWQIQHRSLLKMAIFWSKIPFIGSLYSIYQTSFFTLEWGQLYSQGLESKQLLECMQQLPNNSLMYEMASIMQGQFLSGRTFSEVIQEMPFLSPEVGIIIYQGEVTGRLGEELLIYSRILLTQFSEKSERFMKWIQPILFGVIALLIIGIYAAMLLPMYQNIGGDFL